MIVTLKKTSTTKPILYWFEEARTKKTTAPLYQGEVEEALEFLGSLGIKVLDAEIHKT